MLKYVEIWHRQSADAAYRRHGIEELETLLEAGAAMSLVVEGNCRRVTIDRAAPTAVSIAAIGTLWVTDVCQARPVQNWVQAVQPGKAPGASRAETD